MASAFFSDVFSGFHSLSDFGLESFSCHLPGLTDAEVYKYDLGTIILVDELRFEALPQVWYRALGRGTAYRETGLGKPRPNMSSRDAVKLASVDLLVEV